MKKNNDSFVVEFWSYVFYWLRKISIFSFIRMLFPRYTSTHRFVDIWAILNTIFSVAAIFIIIYLDLHQVINYIIIAYGALRVFEVVIYQSNVLLFDEFRAVRNKKTYSVRSYRRMVILLLHNYVEIVGWFAVSYAFFVNSFSDTSSSGLSMFYYSFVNMASFSSLLQPVSEWALLIITAQTIIGIFMTLLSIARFISLFPKPETFDENER